MPLTYQTFVNAIAQSCGATEITESLRARVITIVLATWNFTTNGTDENEVAEKYGRKLTPALKEYAKRVVETIRTVHSMDETLRKDLWNYSEIAHDIQERRNVENDRNRRTFFIVDGPQELPGIAPVEA